MTTKECIQEYCSLFSEGKNYMGENKVIEGIRELKTCFSRIQYTVFESAV